MPEKTVDELKAEIEKLNKKYSDVYEEKENFRRQTYLFEVDISNLKKEKDQLLEIIGNLSEGIAGRK